MKSYLNFYSFLLSSERLHKVRCQALHGIPANRDRCWQIPFTCSEFRGAIGQNRHTKLPKPGPVWSKPGKDFGAERNDFRKDCRDGRPPLQLSR